MIDVYKEKVSNVQMFTNIFCSTIFSNFFSRDYFRRVKSRRAIFSSELYKLVFFIISVITFLIRWVPCPASLTGGGHMLLYFKPGSHPWDTRIQVNMVDWCTGVVGKMIYHHNNYNHHGDELFCSQWLTLCQCEGWKCLLEGLDGKT